MTTTKVRFPGWALLLSILLAATSIAIPSGASAGVENLGPCTEIGGHHVLSDDSLLVIGSTADCPESRRFMFVAKVRPDGTFDTAYGDGGVVVHRGIRLDGLGGRLNSALMSGGRLLVVDRNSIFRFAADGTIDRDFGHQGRIFHGFRAAGHSAIQTISVSADDRIVLSGENGFANSAVRVLLESGKVDPEFAGGGFTGFHLRKLPGTDRFLDMEIGAAESDDQGNVYLEMTFRAIPSDSAENEIVGIGVAKLGPNGKPDPSFGEQNGFRPIPESYIEDPRGNYLTAAGLTLAEGGEIRLLRAKFGSDGTEEMYPDLTTLTLGPDGVATGLGPIARPGQSNEFTSWRNTTNGWAVSLAAYRNSVWLRKHELAGGLFGVTGAPAPGFEPSGGFVGERIGRTTRAWSASGTGDGGLTLSGTAVADRCASGGRMLFCGKVGAIARYTGEGELDSSFADGGVLTIPSLRCPGTSDPGRGQFACRNGAVTKARVRAWVPGGDLRGGRLIVEVSPRADGPRGIRPWRQLGIRVGSANWKSGEFGRLRAWPGFARGLKPLPEIAFKAPGSTLRIMRVREWRTDRLKIAIPWGALGYQRERLLKGRSFTVEVRAEAGHGQKALLTKVEVPVQG